MSLLNISDLLNASNYNPTPTLSPNEIPFGIPNGYSSTYQNSPQIVESETRDFVAKTNSEIQQALAHPDPKVMDQLFKVNQKLSSQGKTPIDLQNMTRDIETIYNNKSLSDKEKKQQIEQLRKQLGLSKKEMKGLFTKRIAKVYENAAKSLQQYEQAKQAQFSQELKQAEDTYGKNSPQAQAVRQKMQVLQNTIEPQRQEYAQHANFYKSLYPSFWSKVGGILRKIGGSIMKGLSFIKPFVSMIPVFGPIASRVIKGIETLVNAIHSKGKSLLDMGLNFAKAYLPLKQ
jgi:small-conductance mechanosensitive channel